MDPLDPLSTSDPAAPHTSSISSNRFLLKKAEDRPILGNILKVIRADELGTEFQGVWVATAVPEGEVEGEKTALVHIQGVKLVWKGGKAALAEAAQGRALVRLVAGEAKGREIGELQGVKVYAEVETEATEEKADVDALLRAMSGVFPYNERILAYYLYTHFKQFPTLVAANSDADLPSDLVEAISHLNLGKFRTGVPLSAASAELSTKSESPPAPIPQSSTSELPLEASEALVSIAPTFPQSSPSELPLSETSEALKAEASEVLQAKAVEPPQTQAFDVLSTETSAVQTSQRQVSS